MLSLVIGRWIVGHACCIGWVVWARFGDFAGLARVSLASWEGVVTPDEKVRSSIPRNKIFSLGCEGEDYGEFFGPLWERFEASRRSVGSFRLVGFVGRWVVGRACCFGWVVGRAAPGEERLERRKGWPHWRCLPVRLQGVGSFRLVGLVGRWVVGRACCFGWMVGRASLISLVWLGSLLASWEGGLTPDAKVESSIPRNKIFSRGCEGEDYREFFGPLWERFEAQRRVGRSVPFGWWAVLLRLVVVGCGSRLLSRLVVVGWVGLGRSVPRSRLRLSVGRWVVKGRTIANFFALCGRDFFLLFLVFLLFFVFSLPCCCGWLWSVGSVSVGRFGRWVVKGRTIANFFALCGRDFFFAFFGSLGSSIFF